VRLIFTVGSWLDQRLQLGSPIRETMQHAIPPQTASWAYVFGSAAMTVFAFQLVTGILLALIYVPSVGEAWNSLECSAFRRSKTKPSPERSCGLR